MNKLTKLLKISSWAVIIASIAIPLFNYFVGKDIVLGYIETKYLINLVVANSSVDFNAISTALTSIVIAKDILLILTTTFHQLLFLLVLRSIVKKRKGIIKYIFLILFHLLSYVGIILTYYFYINLNVDVNFIAVETSLIIALQLINSILFVVFTLLFIKEKLSNIRPLSPQSFLNAIYYVLRLTTVILIIAFALITLNIIVIYNLALMVISNISFEELFNLPPSLQYDLLTLFTNLPATAKIFITSFEFRHWLFELINGEIIVHIATLSSRIQTELTSIVGKYFDIYFPAMAIMLGYYVIMQTTNFFHKKLEYKNIIPVILMTVTVVYGTSNLPNIEILKNINGIIIVSLVLYIILIIDKVLTDYKYTNKVCEVINKFKLSDSAKEFYDQVIISSKSLHSSSKKVFEKSKDKASKLKEKVINKKDEKIKEMKKTDIKEDEKKEAESKNEKKDEQEVESKEVKKETAKTDSKSKPSTAKKAPAKKKTTPKNKSTTTTKKTTTKKASSTKK